jgi:polyhydroxyalkanoate synthesis regulator phasin
LKYKKEMIDLSNLVHPNASKSKTVEYNGEQVSVIEAIMKGYAVSADTWEVAQSDAGQQVAKAVKEGKITKEEATEILTEAKNENWIALLEEGKLGILAALRNIRNILKGGSAGAIKLLCALVSNGELIRKGKVLPHQLDTATQIVLDEFSNMESREIVTALCKGYEAAIPNLAEVMTGKTCVFLDVSGSMQTPMTDSNKKRIGNCLQKGALIAATIAKATNADIIVFEGIAKRIQYNPNMDVWTLAKSLQLSGGSTNMAAPWNIITNENAQYDRVVVVSDNEANGHSQYTAYKNYIEKVADPYVYSIDLAVYGTHILKGEKLRYYYGYGYEWMNQIMKGEVKLADVLEEISKVKF